MEDRRSFFKKVIGLVGFATLLSKSRLAFAKKLAIKLDKVPALSKVGGSVEVKLAGVQILLVRRSEKEIAGLSTICTHQSCPLKYNAKTANLHCSCHGSAFALSGKVLKGPATKDLKTFPAALDGDRIIITVN
jgi:Rieske Fe-S protein